MDKRGTILDIAREVSTLMRDADIAGVVIGGVAVVLHGYIRTTNDVDVLIHPPLEPFADLLTANGFSLDEKEKQFIKQGVALHLVLPDQVKQSVSETVEIDGVTTVSLADLIEIKLQSGSENLLRAQDLADVIGLIRHHQLTGGFARHLEKSLRPAFRKLVRLIEKENSER